MQNIKLLIVSTSTVHGSGYLEYIKPEVTKFFNGVHKLLFIPYARPSGISYDDYTSKAKGVFQSLGIEVKGIHEWSTPTDGLDWAEGIFTGGGNTFLLTKQLYDNGLITEIQNRVREGLPYMGTSAGSNITGLSICTTNDMPIVYPPSFDALQLVPFNINPHYLDPIPDSTHMGETRETRINEFHFQHNQPVVGLREGSALHVENNRISLYGNHSMRIFEKGKPAYELSKEDDLQFLIQ